MLGVGKKKRTRAYRRRKIKPEIKMVRTRPDIYKGTGKREGKKARDPNTDWKQFAAGIEQKSAQRRGGGAKREWNL